MAKEIKGNLFNQAEESLKEPDTIEETDELKQLKQFAKQGNANKKSDDVKRVTMLINKDLADAVDDLTRSQEHPHGFKSRFYNLAIKRLLEEYENM
ncbi:hypothetical protein MHY86_08715 [Aerococcus urinaeequi]|uniref:hypothetical protein n=1 Tax=Aerococcus urinaeequi TaxID=51665 RepID=UPI00227EEEE2|nr:hypothetical protein [Aerococcus urinaeequi]MCY7731780.1 hypothetical protein [Aerococcus urinaeequi]